MTQETLLQEMEKAVALVRVLRSEGDQALAKLMASEAERAKMRPFVVQNPADAPCDRQGLRVWGRIG